MTDDFEQIVIQSLSRLETQMESIVGNGQPGRICLLEEDVKGLRESRSWFMGSMAALSAIITLAGTWLFTHLFGGK